MKGAGTTVANSSAPSARQLRAVLDDTLTRLDADDRAGPLLRATGIAVRFELADVNLVLNVAASDDPHHCVAWSWGDRKPAKLILEMDSQTANCYLQGHESLAIGIARGRVRSTGDSRSALLYLPVLRLIVDPYRKSVSERYPQLAVAA